MKVLYFLTEVVATQVYVFLQTQQTVYEEYVYFLM